MTTTRVCYKAITYFSGEITDYSQQEKAQKYAARFFEGLLWVGCSGASLVAKEVLKRYGFCSTSQWLGVAALTVMVKRFVDFSGTFAEEIGDEVIGRGKIESYLNNLANNQTKMDNHLQIHKDCLNGFKTAKTKQEALKAVEKLDPIPSFMQGECRENAKKFNDSFKEAINALPDDITEEDLKKACQEETTHTEEADQEKPIEPKTIGEYLEIVETRIEHQKTHIANIKEKQVKCRSSLEDCPMGKMFERVMWGGATVSSLILGAIFWRVGITRLTTVISTVSSLFLSKLCLTSLLEKLGERLEEWNMQAKLKAMAEKTRKSKEAEEHQQKIDQETQQALVKLTKSVVEDKETDSAKFMGKMIEEINALQETMKSVMKMGGNTSLAKYIDTESTHVLKILKLSVDRYSKESSVTEQSKIFGGFQGHLGKFVGSILNERVLTVIEDLQKNWNSHNTSPAILIKAMQKAEKEVKMFQGEGQERLNEIFKETRTFITNQCQGLNEETAKNEDFSELYKEFFTQLDKLRYGIIEKEVERLKSHFSEAVNFKSYSKIVELFLHRFNELEKKKQVLTKEDVLAADEHKSLIESIDALMNLYNIQSLRLLGIFLGTSLKERTTSEDKTFHDTLSTTVLGETCVAETRLCNLSQEIKKFFEDIKEPLDKVRKEKEELFEAENLDKDKLKKWYLSFTKDVFVPLQNFLKRQKQN